MLLVLMLLFVLVSGDQNIIATTTTTTTTTDTRPQAMETGSGHRKVRPNAATLPSHEHLQTGALVVVRANSAMKCK